MPSHTHTRPYGPSSGSTSIHAPRTGRLDGTWTWHAAGGAGAHNNIQPYITMNYYVNVNNNKKVPVGSVIPIFGYNNAIKHGCYKL